MATYRISDKESAISATMLLFAKPNFPCGASNNIEASRFDGFQQLSSC
ncbi:hypothetical protein VIH_002376 [Vibrio cholerae CT 5369-93]|nr:hypothetical protein VIH_002376 [Vibrio cholerae CT 5369-93]